MLMILLIIANAYVAALIASKYVKKNRGMLLDMPDWRLISDMTVILFVLVFGVVLLFRYYLHIGGSFQNYEIFIFVLICIVVVWGVLRNKKIFSGIVRYSSKNIGWMQSLYDAINGEENNDDEYGDLIQQRKYNRQKEIVQQEKSEKHKRRMEDVIAYAEYTLLYTIKNCLLIFLLETICFYLFSEFLPQIDILHSFLNMMKEESKDANLIDMVLILMCVGIAVTLLRIIAVVQCAWNRPKIKPLERIKEYLRDEETKN